MPTLPNMNLITPAQGGDRGTWDDKINACFVQIDAHNHTSGKGVRVPVAGLNIDTDINMGSKGLTSLGRAAFAEITALTTGARTLFVSSSDHELYWRTNAGTNVKLTNGASINTSLVGGIVGDYASVGAEVAFVDANKVYTFKDQSSPTKKWARLASGPVRIYEYNSTDSVYVEHAVDATLAASYTATWPAALPGSQTLVQIGASGVVSFSNTLGNNQKLTLQGTGYIAHGAWVKNFTIHPDVVPSGSVSGGTDGNGGFGESIMAVSTVMYSRIDGLFPSDQITSVVVGCDLLTGSSLTFDLVTRDEFGALVSVLSAPTTSTTLTPSGGTASFGTGTMYLKATTDGSTTAALYTMSVTITRN